MKQLMKIYESIESVSDIDKRYPVAYSYMDNLEIKDDIPNTRSISASLTNYKVLDGIRLIPASEFETDVRELFYAASDIDKVYTIADQIKDNGWIKPLIAVYEKDGVYILEGGHRLPALVIAGYDKIPALVVIDMDNI